VIHTTVSDSGSIPLSSISLTGYLPIGIPWRHQLPEAV